jgi:putative DNA primase/helicase
MARFAGGESRVNEQDDIAKKIASAEIVAFPSRPQAAEESGEGARSDPDASSRTGGSEEARRQKRPPDDDDNLDLRLAQIPLTDLGNAERFALRNAQKLRFCPAIGWLYWDGRRWALNGAQQEVERREHQVVRAIQDEAAALKESKYDWLVDEKKDIYRSDIVRKWGRASETSGRMKAISKHAAAMLAIDVERLDADQMKINVMNGTLHVRKTADSDYVTLHPHDPADCITKLSPVSYDPAAECPSFRRFLDEIQPPGDDGKRDMQHFLAQWFGYGQTGDTGEQKMVFFYGRGRNGKGVLVNVMSHVSGNYAASVGIETFIDSGRARAGGQATPDLAKLPGVRLLTTSEPKKGAALDEGLIKLVTGGDPIDARHLNKDFFSFVPRFKLTMQGNYRPKVSGTDDGIWNRILLVPFGVYIPKERRDPRLVEKLLLEAPGVLNWMLDGLRMWLDRGLVLPSEVQSATEDYRSDSDPLGRFLEACTKQDIGKRVQSSEMHALFCAWAKANGETEWSSKGLAAALKERGLAAKKSVNVYWLDISLTKRVFDFIDAEGKPIRHPQDDGFDGIGADDDA